MLLPLLPLALLLVDGPSPAPARSYTATLRADAPLVRATVRAAWVQAFVDDAAGLPPRAPRAVWRDKGRNVAWPEQTLEVLPSEAKLDLVREELDDEAYYAKYSSPLAYARMLDVADARGGLHGLRGKRVADFGYGDIGQLQLFSLAGARAVGVDVNPLLPALYHLPEDRAFPPGSVDIAHGRWPGDARVRGVVGERVDVFFSKNTLKRGYVRPQVPAGQTVNPKYLIDLGVEPLAFLAALHDAVAPGGLVVIYNLCPAPSTGPEFLPWSDGRSPWTEAEWQAAGFRVLAFDVDDSAAARRLGRALSWDHGEDPMDLEHDLFAWFTIAERTR